MVTVNDITPTTPDKLTLTLTQGGVNKVLTHVRCVKCGFITYAKDADDKQSGINILAFERLELVGGNITCPRCDLSFLEVDYTDMAAVDTEPSPLKETLDPLPTKETILNEIKAAWDKWPNLRLMQLIFNALDANNKDVFYVGFKELIKALNTPPTPPTPCLPCEYCKHFNFKSSGLKNWGACSNEKTNAAMYISLRHVDPELHKEVGKANIFLCESDFGCIYFEEGEHDNTGII